MNPTSEKEVLPGKFEVWADPRPSLSGTVFAEKVHGKFASKGAEQLQADGIFSLQLREDIAKLSGIERRMRIATRHWTRFSEIIEVGPAASDLLKASSSGN